jgi:hypothetical protein
VINLSNYTSKDNPEWPRPGLSETAPGPGRGDPGGSPSRGGAAARVRDALAVAAGVLLEWLAYFLRRWGDRLFAMTDTEAYWWGWQISKVRGGLGRRYRDAQFDTLAACARCAGAGVWADAPCVPCVGTGRITIRGVS